MLECVLWLPGYLRPDRSATSLFILDSNIATSAMMASVQWSLCCLDAAHFDACTIIGNDLDEKEDRDFGGAQDNYPSPGAMHS